MIALQKMNRRGHGIGAQRENIRRLDATACLLADAVEELAPADDRSESDEATIVALRAMASVIRHAGIDPDGAAPAAERALSRLAFLRPAVHREALRLAPWIDDESVALRRGTLLP